MSQRFHVSRRQVLHGIAAGAAASTALVPFGTGRAMAKDLVVGFIYVGPKDDYGYNQAHAEGAADDEEDARASSCVEEENVPETIDVAEDHGRA